MKISELTKLLRRNGCYFVENGTRHDTWYSPHTNAEFLVPRHPSKEIPTGTLHKIMKDAGLK